MHPELQHLDVERVLAHVPTPLVALQVGTGTPLYANHTARRLPFAYRELEGWTAIDEHGQPLARAALPHRAASRGERFDARVVHYVSESGRFALAFRSHGLGGDTCVLAFEDVTATGDLPHRCLVVENLLEANRLRAGEFTLEVTRGSLAAAIEDARGLLGAHAAAVDVVIEDRGEGAWDQARIARASANVVMDAIDRGGGRIAVEVTRLGRAALVRARCTRTPSAARRSLGMFIAREIVTAHRGVLDVQAGQSRLVLPFAA